MKEYNKAKELHEKALMINKKIFGEDNTHTASSYFNLATVYRNLGEYNQAKELKEKALMIRKKIFGEDHADWYGIKLSTTWHQCTLSRH